MQKDPVQLEREASKNKERVYTDPETGYRVFTSYGLRQREDCCGCGCRHCPFGHRSVSPEYRKELQQNPWLEDEPITATEFDVVSWSGGKDSYLALRMMQKENRRPLLLMTTFDGLSENVAHQEVLLSMIKEQARKLNLPLLLVPLYSNQPYMGRIEEGLALLSQRHRVRRLIFGDLHLEHIRSWREKELHSLMKEYDFTLEFPLWNLDYDVLLQELILSGLQCRISAIADEACKKIIRIGELFDQELIRRLPREVDVFGENGEFHTYVSFA